MKSKEYDADTDKRSSREKPVDWTAQKTGKKIQERKIVSCCYQISMEKDGTYIIFQLREGWEES